MIYKVKTIAIMMLLVAAMSISIEAQAAKPSLSSLMPASTTVATVMAKEVPWQPSTQAVGTLSAYKGAMLTAEAAGRVTKIYFKSGQVVKKGQRLVDIYPDIQQAALNQALADQELNCMTYKRYQKLATQDYATQEKRDQSLAECQKSIATVDQIKAQLTQYEIKAPFSGKLGLMQISLGQYLAAGDKLVDLQSLNPLRVEFSLPEKYLSKIKNGQTVSLKSDAYPQQNFTGKVYAINSSIDSDTRMITIRASIPNDDSKLLPGSFVNVRLYLDQPQPVIMVPTTAVQYSESGDYVYLLSKDKTKPIKTPVQLGKQLDQNEVIITQGVQEGDTVIINGDKLNITGDMRVTPGKNDSIISQEYNNKNKTATQAGNKNDASSNKQQSATSSASDQADNATDSDSKADTTMQQSANTTASQAKVDQAGETNSTTNG